MWDYAHSALVIGAANLAGTDGWPSLDAGVPVDMAAMDTITQERTGALFNVIVSALGSVPEVPPNSPAGLLEREHRTRRLVRGATGLATRSRWGNAPLEVRETQGAFQARLGAVADGNVEDLLALAFGVLPIQTTFDALRWIQDPTFEWIWQYNGSGR